MLDVEHSLCVVASKDTIAKVGKPEYGHLSASIGIYEIYLDKLYDLLNKRREVHPRDVCSDIIMITGLARRTIIIMALLALP
ncbi:hypothetical protein BC940DRAFT_363448 [Gongronella butleri]|nr:hypothetical protein BC940DRAFT_363448 [Gongronella butleri]